MNKQTAFSGTLQQLIEFTSILLRSEPLDNEIERRCKHACEQTPCPDCGEAALSAGDSSPRARPRFRLQLWCSHCRYPFTYTRHTPFEARTLTPGEVIIAFILYTDTLLSINQVAQFFEAVYDTVHTIIREVESAFENGFHLVWTHLQEDGDGSTQVDETGQKCSGFKGQTPPRERPSRGGDGEPG